MGGFSTGIPDEWPSLAISKNIQLTIAYDLSPAFIGSLGSPASSRTLHSSCSSIGGEDLPPAAHKQAQEVNSTPSSPSCQKAQETISAPSSSSCQCSETYAFPPRYTLTSSSSRGSKWVKGTGFDAHCLAESGCPPGLSKPGLVFAFFF